MLHRISEILSSHASIFVIATAVAAFFFPEAFAWVANGLDKYCQTLILGIIMLTMGLTLTTNDFKVLFSRPLDILIGAAAQFTIMPLVAYSLSWLFSLVPAFSEYAKPMAIGMLLVGCCPGGVSSNIMSFLCKGDVAYSVGMTCASTLLAPFLTPLLVLWLAGEKVDVDAIGMFKQILIVTIIPIAIGFVLNMLFGRNSETAGKESLTTFQKIQRCMPGLSVLCLACIVGGVVYTAHEPLMNNGLTLFALTFSMVFMHNTTGYLLGYTVGRLFKFNVAKRRTLSIEVGMQNAGLGTVLATNFFVKTAICPLAVVPCAISCAWHSISGTILAGLFKRSDR